MVPCPMQKDSLGLIVMFRLFCFFTFALICAFGVMWIANQPGMVSINWGNYLIETELGVASVILAIIIFIAVAVWAILRTILHIPDLTARILQQRRRDKGYSAFTKGLISLGAGDAHSASKLAQTAEKYLADEPAVKFLLAQTAQLTGNMVETRRRFEQLVQSSDTRLLGYHGLYVEAIRQNKPIVAQQYAEEAIKLSPKSPWAADAVFNLRVAAQNWEEALKSLEGNYRNKLLEKARYRRLKAVILTALSMELEQRNPELAKNLAVEAHSIDYGLIPAAEIAGRLHTRNGDIRKASKVLETTWKKFPHPEIAQAYAYVRPGDSIQDRWKRVKYLASLRPNHIESKLMLAQAAVEAQEYVEARTQLEKVIAIDPTQRSFLLMAKLEESENGDQGLSRQWMAKALNAPKDFTWVADGVEFQDWAPVSPISKKLDAFSWERPKNNSRNQIIDAHLIGSKSEIWQKESKFNDEKSDHPDTSVGVESVGNGGIDDDNEIYKVNGTDSDRAVESNTEKDFKGNTENFHTGANMSVRGDSVEEIGKEIRIGKEVQSSQKSKDYVETEQNSQSGTEQTDTGVGGDLDKSPSPVKFPLQSAPDDPGPSTEDKS